MRDRCGVTLIELLMTIVVVGLLLGIAITALAPVRSAYSVRAARSTFGTLVAHARARAVEDGRDVLFHIDPVGDSAWFEADSAVLENVRFRESMGVDLVGDAATVCMSARGIADPGCGTLLRSAQLSFEKRGRTATATLLPYGQFLETHSTPGSP